MNYPKRYIHEQTTTQGGGFRYLCPTCGHFHYLGKPSRAIVESYCEHENFNIQVIPANRQGFDTREWEIVDEVIVSTTCVMEIMLEEMPDLPEPFRATIQQALDILNPMCGGTIYRLSTVEAVLGPHDPDHKEIMRRLNPKGADVLYGKVSPCEFPVVGASADMVGWLKTMLEQSYRPDHRAFAHEVERAMVEANNEQMDRDVEIYPEFRAPPHIHSILDQWDSSWRSNWVQENPRFYER